jgi:ribonuclease E
MVERPIDEEPPIAETEAVEEAKPKGRRRKAAKPEAESPAEEAPPVKPAPKRRAKSGAKSKAAASESVPPAANEDTAETADESGEPRRGWWQKTFG